MNEADVNLSKFIDVGNILEKRRIEVGLSIEQIAQKLKIEPEIISLIEDGNIQHIIQKIYYQGLVSNYAKIIGLKDDKIMGYILKDVENLNNQNSQKLLTMRYRSYIKVTKISLKLFYIIGAISVLVVTTNTIFKTNKSHISSNLVQSEFGF